MTAFWKWPNWPICMGYSPCKMVSLGQKLKMLKRCENDSMTTLKLLCENINAAKHLIFEKWQHFENGKNWLICMGYSPCKMVSFGQKLKMPKRSQKRLYDHIKVVVYKKPLQKTPNIRKMTGFWKWPKLATMHGPMENGQFGSNVKNAKKVRKTIVRPH